MTVGISLVLVLAARPDAQQAAVTQEEFAIRVRVAILAARLDYRDGDDADHERYYSEMDDLTARIRDEIDRYIQTVVDPRESSEQIAARLARLIPRTPHPEYGDPPFARVTDLSAGRVLLVAYTIVRPPHHDSATVRGYLQVGTRFELASVTAEDFDGYGMFKRELPSPLRSESWLMAWGQSEGGNGRIIRPRIYAFDGFQFRTVWAPDNLFNATPSFSASGFAIEHSVPQPPYTIRDEYVLSTSGPIQIR